jgi:hypothetical protein
MNKIALRLNAFRLQNFFLNTLIAVLRSYSSMKIRVQLTINQILYAMKTFTSKTELSKICTGKAIYLHVASLGFVLVTKKSLFATVRYLSKCVGTYECTDHSVHIGF